VTIMKNQICLCHRITSKYFIWPNRKLHVNEVFWFWHCVDLEINANVSGNTLSPSSGPLKIHHPQPGLNPQTLGPMASTVTNYTTGDDHCCITTVVQSRQYSSKNSAMQIIRSNHSSIDGRFLASAALALAVRVQRSNFTLHQI
jgi:hypothetical protein